MYKRQLLYDSPTLREIGMTWKLIANNQREAEEIKSIVDEFNIRFSKAVDSLKLGMPWDDSFLTPLPEPSKPAYIQNLIKERQKWLNLIY